MLSLTLQEQCEAIVKVSGYTDHVFQVPSLNVPDY